jgi:hypothetical protein
VNNFVRLVIIRGLVVVVVNLNEVVVFVIVYPFLLFLRYGATTIITSSAVLLPFLWSSSRNATGRKVELRATIPVASWA